jgi:N-methylhydantoinase B/oxoprolinase/acetone carboxylase alpha subunit
MEGGAPGALGINTWIKQPRKEDGDYAQDSDAPLHPRKINIGGKATVYMGKGDKLLIETPGAGAWGAGENHLLDEDISHLKAWQARGSLTSKSQPEFGGF